ncbi:MAG: hypothetical protein F6K39_26965 [Okeania sp. SIO3B3]|nr:hypothetical protein [Okeania sp. SIO3B3]
MVQKGGYFRRIVGHKNPKLTIVTDKLWFKASPFKGKKEKNFPSNQSSSFQGEVI